jgi:hypothetical protein
VIFVYLTLGVSIFAYGRFCTLVINDITNYMGIACFTVRKKDAEGVWRDAKAPAAATNNATTVKELQNAKLKTN